MDDYLTSLKIITDWMGLGTPVAACRASSSCMIGEARVPCDDIFILAALVVNWSTGYRQLVVFDSPVYSAIVCCG